MQAVAGTNLPFLTQAAERAPEEGAASKGKTAKTGSMPQTEEDSFRFNKLITQETAGKKKTNDDPKAESESVCEAEHAKEDGDFCHAAAANGLIAQLFVLQSPETGHAPAVGNPVDPVPLSAEAQNSGEPADAITVPQHEAETATAFPAAQGETGSAAVPAAPFGELPTAVPAEQKNRQDRQPQQAVQESGTQTEPAAFSGSVAGHIVKTMKSMGGDGKPQQSFGEIFAHEKSGVTNKRIQEDPIAWDFLMTGGEVEGSPDLEKIQAVEKALGRFLNDFHSAQTTGGSELQIVLEPESLGVLTISVSRTEHGISAKIKSEDKELCAILSGHIQKLVQSMESRGVTVENVDVVFGGAEQDLSFTQNGSHSGGEHARNHMVPQTEKTEHSEAINFFDLWSSPPAGTERSSTMEYRV